MLQRRRPVGAEPCADGGTHFRVWAPHARTVDVLSEPESVVELSPEPTGYFAGGVTTAGPGTRYRYRLARPLRCARPPFRPPPDGVHRPPEAAHPPPFPGAEPSWP